MPWNTEELVSERRLSLAEARKLASEIESDPTVQATITTTTEKDGRRMLNIAVPLDNFDSLVRKKEQTLKGGKKKIKVGISAVGFIPPSTTARIIDDETRTTTEYSVKTGNAIRISVGMDLSDEETVPTPDAFKAKPSATLTAK